MLLQRLLTLPMNDASRYAIYVENLKKDFNGINALKGVSFVVERGDIFGYLGPNGAGKTTTIRILLGLLKPTSGAAYVLGENTSSSNAMFKSKVGFVLETDGLYDDLTAYENLDYFAQIYGLPKGKRQERIEEVLALVKIKDRMLDKVSIYSKGMRQRLALARALLHDPELLIFDEPTAGLDPTGQMEIRNLILDLAHRGKTIFLSSHDLDEVQRICNRIAIISGGKIELYGNLNELRKQMSGIEVIIKTQEEEGTLERIVDEVNNLSNVNVCKREGKDLIIRFDKDGALSNIVQMLSIREIRIEQVVRKQLSLEEIYTMTVQRVEGK